MQISVVRPSELGPSEIATWHSMQSETASLANPFLCPEFSIAVGSFRSAARVAILVDGSTIVGFFPFELRRLGIGVPIGFGLTDCQGVIHSPDVEWNAQELLKRATYPHGSSIIWLMARSRSNAMLQSARPHRRLI